MARLVGPHTEAQGRSASSNATRASSHALTTASPPRRPIRQPLAASFANPSPFTNVLAAMPANCPVVLAEQSHPCTRPEPMLSATGQRIATIWLGEGTPLRGQGSTKNESTSSAPSISYPALSRRAPCAFSSKSHTAFGLSELNFRRRLAAYARVPSSISFGLHARARFLS